MEQSAQSKKPSRKKLKCYETFALVEMMNIAYRFSEIMCDGDPMNNIRIFKLYLADKTAKIKEEGHVGPYEVLFERLRKITEQAYDDTKQECIRGHYDDISSYPARDRIRCKNAIQQGIVDMICAMRGYRTPWLNMMLIDGRLILVVNIIAIVGIFYFLCDYFAH